MRTYRDAKAMARTLREALGARRVQLSHSECLEIVAHQFGLPDWNVLAARINRAADPGPDPLPGAGPGMGPGVVPPAVALRPAIPILRVLDVTKAREFYLDFLGFTLDWEHRYEPDLPWYAQISRSGLALHLSEHHGDGIPGATGLVWLTGIDELHRELIAKRYPYARPGIEDKPWNARVLSVADPFGNRLRFNEAKPTAAPDAGDPAGR